MAFHRQYTLPSGLAATLPPGRMLKLIDVGSYRTRHFNFSAARGVLSTAFYFTMFGKRDRIRQLDETAKTLFRCGGGAFPGAKVGQGQRERAYFNGVGCRGFGPEVERRARASCAEGAHPSLG